MDILIKHQHELATIVDVGISRYSHKSGHLFSMLEEHLTQLLLIADVVSDGLSAFRIPFHIHHVIPAFTPESRNPLRV